MCIDMQASGHSLSDPSVGRQSRSEVSQFVYPVCLVCSSILLAVAPDLLGIVVPCRF